MLRWDSFQSFIESAMAARGAMARDEIVYATHIEFGLSNRCGVGVVRGVVSILICGLEEQAETMKRRTHGSPHGDLLNIGEGLKEVNDRIRDRMSNG